MLVLVELAPARAAATALLAAWTREWGAAAGTGVELAAGRELPALLDL